MYTFNQLFSVTSRRPAAYANISGSPAYPGISGRVNFYPMGKGVLTSAEVRGLPVSGNACPGDIFALHIHEGGSCTGTAEDPFANAGMHFNPGACPHPAHAGDLPPLFGNGGYALMAVYTDRFTVDEIIGRTIIVHSRPDDFRSQPSGDSGKKIACGVIKFDKNMRRF